jgi:hypothetical protein
MRNTSAKIVTAYWPKWKRSIDAKIVFCSAKRRLTLNVPCSSAAAILGPAAYGSRLRAVEKVSGASGSQQGARGYEPLVEQVPEGIKMPKL